MPHKFQHNLITQHIIQKENLDFLESNHKQKTLIKLIMNLKESLTYKKIEYCILRHDHLRTLVLKPMNYRSNPLLCHNKRNHMS